MCKQRSVTNLRPLHFETKIFKNVAAKECSENIQRTNVVASEVPNEVKIMKPSLVKKSTGKKKKRSKKRVRFSDSETSPPTGITLCERFVQFFHFLWKNTRSSVKNVLSKFPFIV